MQQQLAALQCAQAELAAERSQVAAQQQASAEQQQHAVQQVQQAAEAHSKLLAQLKRARSAGLLVPVHTSLLPCLATWPVMLKLNSRCCLTQIPREL